MIREVPNAEDWKTNNYEQFKKGTWQSLQGYWFLEVKVSEDHQACWEKSLDLGSENR